MLLYFDVRRRVLGQTDGSLITSASFSLRQKALRMRGVILCGHFTPMCDRKRCMVSFCVVIFTHCFTPMCDRKRCVVSFCVVIFTRCFTPICDRKALRGVILCGHFYSLFYSDVRQKSAALCHFVWSFLLAVLLPCATQSAAITWASGVISCLRFCSPFSSEVNVSHRCPS